MKDEEKLFPLSHPQRRIWYSEKLHPGTSMWNNAGTLKIKGKLNVELFEKAISEFVKRNETIRLRITEMNGVPFQYFVPYKKEKVDILDFSNSGLRQFFEWDQAQTAAPMSMLDSCLYYFAIIKLPGGKGAFYAKVHHIISDGYSLVLISNGVIDNYRALLSGEPLNAEPPGSYIDFINKEREYISSKRFLLDKQYWNQRFEAPPEPTVLKERKETYYGTRARRKAFVLPPRFSMQIREYCKQTNMSVFTFFLSALCTYIFRITGKRDIVVGAPVFNRTTRDSKTAIGMYVSIVPIRIEIDENLPFKRFMQVVSGAWLSVLKHQKYPYNLLLQDLRKTHKGLESLYDITLSYQNAMFNKTTKAFIDEGRWHFNGHMTTSLNVHVDDREGDSRFIMDYDHLVPLFPLKEIEYIHEHMLCIISDVLAHPDNTLSQLNILTEEEHDRILHRFNDTETSFPGGDSLTDLWQAQALRSPEAVAVIAGASSYTYAALDAKASSLAGELRAMDLGPNDIVGVMVDRSIDLFACILGVLKAGCAFLPINAELPADRVAYMLNDCGARALLLSERLKDYCGKDAGIDILTTDTIRALKGTSPKVRVKPEDLAYVIYTSGSTGAPKGVAIEHRSIAHFMHSLSSIMDFSPGNRVLCAASISFDLFIMESLPTLVNGATLVLAAEHETTIPRNLVKLLEKNNVNKLMFTPSRMQLLLSDDRARKYLPNVREIMLGGDILPLSLLREIKASTDARILNFYGPTETTIAATCKDLTESRTVNIGKPMPNTRIYILDTHKNPVPIGVYGEIYISGRGLARGYINRLELTAAAFVDNPFAPGEKMYRTGDLARWYPLGDIEYLGRVDQQVKIRGYRIELGEIETRLSQVTGVRSCAVIDRTDENGRKYLCAYICGNGLPTRSQIITLLSRDLPGYMIPSYFVILDELPLNFSGKLDKKLLPDPLKHAITTVVDDFDPPATETEKALASIWSRILKVHPIGRNDSFFDIGGDSLSIVTAMGEVQNTYHVDISLEDVYREPTLKACAERIDSAEKRGYRPISPVPARRFYPASPAQTRMYVLSMGNGPRTVYNIPLALKLTGALDAAALEKALQDLIQRHDVLRTGFVLRGKRLCQQIRKYVDFRLDVGNCSPSGLRSTLKNLDRPFDLSAPPLMRATLLNTGTDTHILYINIHHSICDGHSMELLLRELCTLYEQKLPIAKGIEYKDYTVWQLDFLASDAGKKQGAYWKSVLGDGVPLLNIHTDRPRGAQQTFAGARLRFTLPDALSEKLRNAAQEQTVTLFMMLLAVYNVFLYKYTSQEDIVVGVPFSGRTRDEVKNIPGMFVNTLPVRTFPKGDMTFAEYLQTVREHFLLALKHGEYPLDLMVNDLGTARSVSRNPLFDTILVLQAVPASLPQMRGVNVSVYPFDPGTAKMDLTMEIFDDTHSLYGEIEYNTALFKKKTVRRMSEHFCNLLEALAERPQLLLKDVQMLSSAEIRELSKMNHTPYALDHKTNIQTPFEQCAKRHPDKPALIMDGNTLTYAQLNSRANQIAQHLIELGVQRNDIVAVSLCRSFDLVAGLLGVLKSGAGYLPIDPAYPQERISFILSDSRAAFLLTDDPEYAGYAGKTVHVGSIAGYSGDAENPAVSNSPRDIAYVIYTSGSTGKPKGVTLTRIGLLNLYENTKLVMGYQPDDVSVSMSTVAFDMFILDTILPLLFGCTNIFCNDEEQRQTHLLNSLLVNHRVNIITATPTRMQHMLNDRSFRRILAGMRIIVLGGEMFPQSLLRYLKRNTQAQIINLYGPSEITVYCTSKNLTKSTRTSIGRPIINTRVYILDKHHNPVPAGIPGEAYVSGIGVGTGYINRKELTKEKFLPDPFMPGETMYRTGDVCVLNPSGDIEMLGRLDHQVKINGLRIELGEIEAAIRAYPGIGEAVVKDFGKNTDKYLAAYFTVSKPVDVLALREGLGNKLPVYMIPSHFIEVKRLPLMPSGKVDRQALPEPSRASMQRAARGKSVPLTQTERTMRRVWSKILGVKNIGTDDNFFALGGSSLDVIRVQAAILQYDWTIRTQDFYELQTLGAVCCAIGQAPASINSEEALEAKKNAPVNRINRPIKGVLLQNVLLTGATGFLGVHLLYELITAHGSIVHCLVRDNKHIESLQRLRQTLAFYFGTKQSEKLMQNIRLVPGDVSSRHMGLTVKEWEALGKNVSTVIHCAALTSHIGRAELFTQVNVTGTSNVVAFCEQANASLLHVSTLSVSGTRYRDDPGRNGAFSEDCYYIGQNYMDNEYVKTKFLAEGLVLDAVDRGLDARIFRVGNLTARYADAKFQINPHVNAFAGRIRSLATLGCVPMGMLATAFEMTPVDKCAQALLALSRLDGANTRIFHVYNPHDLTVSDLVNAMRAEGVNMDTVSNEAFGTLLKDLSRRGEFDGLSGIISVTGSDMPAPHIVPASPKTKNCLSLVGFEWPRPDMGYIRSFIHSLLSA